MIIGDAKFVVQHITHDFLKIRTQSQKSLGLHPVANKIKILTQSVVTVKSL